jgi:hypothetical protein
MAWSKHTNTNTDNRFSVSRLLELRQATNAFLNRCAFRLETHPQTQSPHPHNCRLTRRSFFICFGSGSVLFHVGRARCLKFDF